MVGTFEQRLEGDVGRDPLGALRSFQEESKQRGVPACV